MNKFVKFALFGFLVAILARLLSKLKDKASIGIIGGADGPTEIFIAGSGGDNSEENESEENKMQNPVITIEMENGGIIKAELYPDKAENTVKNFISLAGEGYYDGLIFHRVIEGFMIQGGCPLGTGTGNPGYSIAGEFSSNGYNNDLKHDRGVLSMARSSMPDSAGSQFFIMHKNSPHLDGDYAAFGKVTEGMDVVDAIATCDKDRSDRPIEEQKIKSITVDTFGVEYDKPETISR